MAVATMDASPPLGTAAVHFHRLQRSNLIPPALAAARAARMALAAARAARMALAVARAARMALAAARAARMALDRILRRATLGDQRQMLLQTPSAAANLAHQTDAENLVAESGLHRPHQKPAEHPCAGPHHPSAKADWVASVDCGRIQMIRLRAAIQDQAACDHRHRLHRSHDSSFHDRMDDWTNDHCRHAEGSDLRRLLLDHRDLFRAPSWAANLCAS